MKLKFKLNDTHRDSVAILELHCGSFITYENNNLLTFINAINPSLIPLILIKYCCGQYGPFYIATDGERYCSLHGIGVNAYAESRTSFYAIIPTKSQVHEAINKYAYNAS